MNSIEITITSKNQITLPAAFVRNLKLQRNRVLKAELSGGTIKLTPQASVSDVMSKYWGKHKAKKPLTDDEVSSAIRVGLSKHVR